jgi:hypothetical protein
MLVYGDELDDDACAGPSIRIGWLYLNSDISQIRALWYSRSGS